MRKMHQDGQNLKFAVGFCVFFALILAFMGVDYIIRQIKISQFDGSRQLVISKGNNTYVVVNPASKTVHVVSVSGEDIWPADIISAPFTVSPSSPEKDVMQIYQGSTPSLSSFDAVRLWFLLRSGVTVTQSHETQGQDLLSTSPFWDSLVATDNKTVQIVNASGITGEGNLLAEMLGEYGVRVISVQTGLQTSPVTHIITTGKSYTATRLSYLLHSPVTDTKSKQIADIVIIVGEKHW